MKKPHVSLGLVIWFRPRIITGQRTDDATRPRALPHYSVLTHGSNWCRVTDDDAEAALALRSLLKRTTRVSSLTIVITSN